MRERWADIAGIMPLHRPAYASEWENANCVMYSFFRFQPPPSTSHPFAPPRSNRL